MSFKETAVLFWFAASRRGRYPPSLIHEHNRKREAAEKEVAKEKAAKERAELAEKYGGGEMKKEEMAKSMGVCVFSTCMKTIRVRKDAGEEIVSSYVCL